MNNITKNIILFPFNILYHISPSLDLRILFFLKQKYKLNLKNPKTFNEKLQWIKLYDHNPLMPKCCDKYTVREFVKAQGCEQILNTLLWEGDRAEDIPYASLPEKFVIKVTHGSTFNIICTDKNKLDRGQVVANCNRWLKAKFLPCYGEWFYGIEKPRIIVESYIESDDGEQLKDYKVFCFNGVPKYIRVDSDRFTDHKMDVYDCIWNYIPNVNMGLHCSGNNFEKPECLTELLEYAAKLSVPFLHVRVDFYVVGNKCYFGEMTFTNGSGFDRFETHDFDLEMGNHLKLK